MTITRCGWVATVTDEAYIAYHDKEWSPPMVDQSDQFLFELLTLEGAQAGLSWLTILKKRKGYREEFLQFDIDKVSKMNEKHVDQILTRGKVVKHRGKIQVPWHFWTRRMCNLL